MFTERGCTPRITVSVLAAVVLLLTFYRCIVYTEDQWVKRIPLFRTLFFGVHSNGVVHHSQQKHAASGHAVLCMIFTTPGTWSTRARAVRATWAPRCPYPIFFYSKSAAGANHEIINASDAVPLDVPEGRGHLTGKTMAALRYSYDKYGNKVKWFMKADDDTYVIWENLEKFITQPEQRTHPYYYIGRKFFNLLPKGYNSGGGGYLISRDAVKLMLVEGKNHTQECVQDGGIEDYDIGRCLAKLGIFPSNTVDGFGRLRFHSENPLMVLENNPTLSKLYNINIKGLLIGCKGQCEEMLSRQSITFHYVTPGQMLMFDFLLYHLQRRTMEPLAMNVTLISQSNNIT